MLPGCQLPRQCPTHLSSDHPPALRLFLGHFCLCLCFFFFLLLLLSTIPSGTCGLRVFSNSVLITKNVKDLFYSFFCMCVLSGTRTCAHLLTHAGDCDGSQKHQILRELEVQVVVSCWTWVLGTEPGLHVLSVQH